MVNIMRSLVIVCGSNGKVVKNMNMETCHETMQQEFNQASQEEVNQHSTKSEKRILKSLLNNEKQFVQCQRRISVHLKKLNEILSHMDSEVVKYRALMKLKNQRLYEQPSSQDLTDTRLWWYREIQNELTVFRYYSNYSLKLLCEEHGR